MEGQRLQPGAAPEPLGVGEVEVIDHAIAGHAARTRRAGYRLRRFGLEKPSGIRPPAGRALVVDAGAFAQSSPCREPVPCVQSQPCLESCTSPPDF